MFLSLSKFLSTVNPPREDILVVHYIRVHTDIQVVIMNKYITECLTNQFIAGMSAGQHRGTNRAEFTLQTPVALMPL